MKQKSSLENIQGTLSTTTILRDDLCRLFCKPRLLPRIAAQLEDTYNVAEKEWDFERLKEQFERELEKKKKEKQNNQDSNIIDEDEDEDDENFESFNSQLNQQSVTAFGGAGVFVQCGDLSAREVMRMMVDILLFFSQVSQSVSVHLAEEDVMNHLLIIIPKLNAQKEKQDNKLLMFTKPNKQTQQQTYRVDKEKEEENLTMQVALLTSLRTVAMNQRAAKMLENCGAVRSVVDFFNILPSSKAQNQLVMAAYYLSYLNNRRTEILADAGIIPVLQKFVSSASALAQFALDVLLALPSYTSAVTRQRMWEAHQAQFLLKLLGRHQLLFMHQNVYNALRAWLASADKDRLSKLLSRRDSLPLLLAPFLAGVDIDIDDDDDQNDESQKDYNQQQLSLSQLSFKRGLGSINHGFHSLHVQRPLPLIEWEKLLPQFEKILTLSPSLADAVARSRGLWNRLLLCLGEIEKVYANNALLARGVMGLVLILVVAAKHTKSGIEILNAIGETKILPLVQLMEKKEILIIQQIARALLREFGVEEETAPEIIYKQGDL
ncbi:MAG: hypothetical protein EZS28_000084 [Streblomastix strix]|uniref:Uncharacterized protein n=1 Tax=Streblomastix strix TaxID=222440 RepID=A0A5J4XB27_9EUKA|nr:MAG: hypothetical protein EZS28_000084 [Streblomastix strix]